MRASGYWKPSKHLWWIGDRLLDVFHRRTRRVCFSLPPRHSKSSTITTYYTSWELGRRPNSEVLVCAYAERLALGWSAEARNALHQHGASVFGLTTNPRETSVEWFVRDAATMERAGVGQGGAFRAVGRGGVVTGRGFDIGVCDDLFRDVKEARSPAIRNSAWDFFVSAFLTRASPSGACIVCMTRWHWDDVIGRLQKLQEAMLRAGNEDWIPWEFINLPAIATKPDLHDERGNPQREVGEALWPERFNLKHLRGIKSGPGGPRNWTCLYQGKPTAEDGDIFRREWFRYFTEERGKLIGDSVTSDRERLIIYATLDLAYSTKTSADYSVCCVWGADRQQSVLYLLHLERDRVGVGKLAHWIRRVFSMWGVRLGYVERSGFYADITRSLIVQHRLPLKEIQPNADKVSRAQPAAALCASGGMLFRSGADWIGPLEDELMRFDAGDDDDQVDAVSYGVHVYNRMGGGVSSAGAQEGYEVMEGGTWHVGRR